MSFLGFDVVDTVLPDCFDKPAPTPLFVKAEEDEDGVLWIKTYFVAPGDVFGGHITTLMALEASKQGTFGEWKFIGRLDALKKKFNKKTLARSRFFATGWCIDVGFKVAQVLFCNSKAVAQKMGLCVAAWDTPKCV